MRSISLWLLVSVLGGIFAVNAYADNYDYEFGVTYDANRTKIESPLIGFGVPTPAPQTLTSSYDNDSLGLSGTWHFDGASASSGPLTRTAFLGRASAVSFSLLRSNATSQLGNNSSLGREDWGYSASIRWVSPQSGWYSLGSVSRSKARFDDAMFRPPNFRNNLYSVGFGKYIGAQTTLDISGLRLETGRSGFGQSHSNEVAINLSHIGAMGDAWQYGADINLTTIDKNTSDSSYDLRFSLYPSRSLAFGIETSGALDDPGSNLNYQIFASWFPRKNTEVYASYGALINEEEDFIVDRDSTDFGVGLNFRY